MKNENANINVTAPKANNISFSTLESKEDKENKVTPNVIYNNPKITKNNNLGALVNHSSLALNSNKLNKTAKNPIISDKAKELLVKAHNTRQKQDNVMVGGDIKAKITNNVSLEAKATLYEVMAKYKEKPIPKSSIKDTVKSAGKEGINAVQNALASQDDIGSQTISGAITATTTTYKAYSATDKTVNAVAKTVKELPQTLNNAYIKIEKIGYRTVQIKEATRNTYLTVKKSLPYLKGGFAPFKKQLYLSGKFFNLNKYSAIIRVVSLARKTKRIYRNAKETVKTVKRAYKYVITIKRSVSNGTLRGSFSKEILKQISNKSKPFLFKAKVQSLKTLNSVSKKTAKTAVKASAYTVKKGVPKAAKGIKSATSLAGGIMTASENEMIRGVGHIATATPYLIKTVKVTGKATVKTAKTTVKVGKTAYNGMKYARNNGLKATLKKTKEKASKAVANAGKSAVNLVVNLAKKLLGKMAIPVIIGCLLISVVVGGAGGISGVAGYYLSGEFLFHREDNSITTTDVLTYLSDDSKGAEYIRTEYIKAISSVEDGLAQFFKSEGGAYDKIMIYTENNPEGTYKYATTKEELESVINDSFWSKESLILILQPIFHSGLLAEFGLEPTEEETSRLLKDIVFKSFSLNHFEVAGETCNVPHLCGYIHANEDCCNKKDVIHTEYVCEDCCTKTCKGHRKYVCNKANTNNHTCTDDCKYKIIVEYCEGCEFDKCNGTKICEGHDVYCCYIVLDDVGEFFNEYFEEPIAHLEELGEARSEKQDKKLSMLKDYYEIAKEIIKESSSP